MKKTFVLLIFFVCNYAFSQFKFVLEGRLQNSTKIDKIYLEIRDRYSLNQYVKRDSCVVENGLFRFSGELKKISETASLFFSNEDQFRFVLDAGLNIINVESSTNPVKSFFANAKRPATVSNEIYNKQDSIYKIYFEKYATNVETIITKTGQTKLVKMFNNYEKLTELRRRQIEIVKKYPHSLYSLIYLYETLYVNPYRKEPSGLLKIYNQLDTAVKDDSLGVEFYKACNEILIAERESKPSKPVPNFIIKTDKGKSFNNASLLGKPYVIAFSATWCAPCKIFEPKLKGFFDSYSKNGLEVVYFNLDGDEKKWKEHISKNRLNWINVSDGLKPGYSPISKKFNVQGIPVYLVVDKKGKIIYNSDVPMDSNFSMLEKYIKKAIE